MEILVLLLLYYLSQNPDFPERVKPIMGQLKNSQQMLGFLNDLSAFSHIFDGLKKSSQPSSQPTAQTPPSPREDEKNPQSPTQGIANEFIQQILDGYFKKN